MADWARIEQQRKTWAEQRDRLFANVRGVFVLLLFAAIFVFVQNHFVEVQSAASAGLYQVANKINTPDKLRQHALQYEKDVDEINQ